MLLGSLRFYNGDGSKNVICKWICPNCHFIVIIATYIIRQLLVNSLGDEFVTTSFNFRKRKKKSLYVFTSCTIHQIREFHIVVMQWWQRNVPKSVTHAELLFCQIELISFLTFLLLLPSWHLKLLVTSVCLHMSWKKLMDKTLEIWVASGSSLDCLSSKHQHTVIWVFYLV